MSTTGNLRLAFVIEAIDRATATVGRVNKVIDRITQPINRVRGATQALVRESRFERVQAAWAKLGNAGQNFSNWVRGAASGVAALTFAAAGVGFAMQRSFDSVDRLSDQAQKLGITTQAYQKLGFAAKLSGSSEEEMGTALQFLSQNMVEAINGSKEMQAWFSRVGLSSQQLSKMNVQQVLERISDVFEQVGDSGQNAAAKIAFAKAVMGRSGADMVQTLNRGSKGLQDLYSKAERMGVVLSTDTVSRISAFNDEVDVMSAVTKSAFATVAGAAIPVLTRVVNGVTEWSNANRDLVATRVAEFVERVLPKLPAFLTAVVQIGGAVAALVILVNDVVQALGGWEAVMAALVGVIIGKGLVAMYSLTTATWGFVAALAATPFGWVAAGIAALVVGAGVVIRYWEPISEFFSGLWDKITRIFSALRRITNTSSEGAPSIYASADEWARYRGTAGGGAPGMLAAAGATRADVSGRIRIEVDSQGKLRRFEAEGSKGIEFDGYAGVPMAGP